MTSQHPLQVYLDSSDFSDLSDPKKATVCRPVALQLIEWRNKGKIEIRCSQAHVCEMAPTAPQHLDLARRRAECIVQLCGKRTLLAHGDLATAEVVALHRRTPLEPQHVRNDAGMWMPLMNPKDLEFPP
jgi:hypothetical protein